MVKPLLLIVASISLACGSTSLRGEGESCVRSLECATGLVCVANACSGDASGLGGTVPSLDAGEPIEPIDAGDEDGGTMMETDAGMMETDAGMMETDAGMMGTDAGVDAGSPPVDAGVDSGPEPEMDAGVDAGPEMDAGDGMEGG